LSPYQYQAKLSVLIRTIHFTDIEVVCFPERADKQLNLQQKGEDMTATDGVRQNFHPPPAARYLME